MNESRIDTVWMPEEEQIDLELERMEAEIRAIESEILVREIGMDCYDLIDCR